MIASIEKTVMKLAESMAAEGYLPGLPVGLLGGFVLADVEVALSLPCEACGGEGGCYLPFTSPANGGYRACCVCVHCGESSEF